MRELGAAAIASACSLLTACHRSPPPRETLTDAGATSVTASGAGASDAGLAPPRCKLEETGATLADLGDRRALVVGEAALTPDGFVVGVVHAPAAGAEALVARVAGHQVAEEWVVARRTELVADAPPPKPLVAPSGLYAALISTAGRPSDAGGVPSRRIALQKSGVAAPLASYLEHADESLAFDAALSADSSRAALVWDEDAQDHGGITLAVVPLGGGQPLAPRVVSGGTEDPDGPRIAARASGGWWVAWTARRSEPTADASARPVAAVEGPAEDRGFAWVEVAAVDSDGAAAGPPRRLTSASGHVASFDLAPRPHGELDVVVRDETQAREGEGGRIVHVVVRSDGGVDEPTVIVPGGAGRGSVDLVTGDAGQAWLAFADAQDHTLVLPLREARAPSGLPSLEGALDGGRLLLMTHAGSPLRFAATFPAADGALFRDVACVP